MKGHYIARALTGLTWVWLVLYTIWLRTQQAVVVTEAQLALNVAVLSAVLILGVYFLAVVARPEYAPNNRWMLAVLWVVLIVLSDRMLQDTPSAHIYLQDILKIIGAMLVITWPMKLLMTKEAQEKKFMEEAQIIEV